MDDKWFIEFSRNGKYSFPGASAAAMLIFILPSAFYIKLVKKETMKSVQKIGVSKIMTIETVIFQYQKFLNWF